MRKLFFVTLAVLCSQSSFTFGQAPFIQWQKCLGGPSTEYPKTGQALPDGNYILGGITSSFGGDVSGKHGGKDIWIVEIDSLGSILWQKCLGGDSAEFASDIKQTSDGGFIVTGYTYSNEGDVTYNHGNADVWVIKLDSLGNIEWQKCYGGSNEDIGDGLAILNNGYVVVSRVYSPDGDVVDKNGNADNADIWFIKLDLVGTILSQKCLGGHKDEGPSGIIIDADSNIIVAGYSFSDNGDLTKNNGESDIWIIKLNSADSILLQKSYGGTKADQMAGPNSTLQQTPDGGYMVAGYTASNDSDVNGNHGGYDIWVIEIDSALNLLSQKCLGGSQNEDIFDLKQTDGGFIVSGCSRSFDGDVSYNQGETDVWIAEMNSMDSILWQKTYGGASFDDGLNLFIITAGEYLLAGGTFSNDGDVTGNHGEEDTWIVKLSWGVATSIPEIGSRVSVYPNPFSDHISISRNVDGLTMTDVWGREMKNSFSNGRMNTENLPKGPYILYSKEENFSRKLIKQ